MSLINYAKSVGAVRLPSFTLADGSSCVVYVDRAQEPEHIALHQLAHGKRRCTGEGCKLCAAEVPRRENWIVHVDKEEEQGLVVPCALWLTKQQLGAFAQATDNGTEAGTAAVLVQKVPETDEDGRKKPKPGGSLEEGPYWHRTVFSPATNAGE